MLLTAPIPSRLLSVFGDAEWSDVCYAATKRTGHQLSLRLDVWDGFDLDAPNHHHSFHATVAGFIFSEVQQLGASEGGLADGYTEETLLAGSVISYRNLHNWRTHILHMHFLATSRNHKHIA